ncbi:hypothetical protein QM797_17275 [Rhodococcus sp. IEGM 1381]|uniref:hypothetical protein n=1 Tax=Rhodococcus sp. IEGM 1381 TaxID=3047085 RepID=UPI0024B66A9A|nr:hypothetical protein [Rhodococcus sp. IEGM 1381]MDI9896479.1 hypothetical protein [Rhodococcus sp. IEGM 1381]
MHDSTITNDPRIIASSNIRTVNGVSVTKTYMGVMARLFKSGILCEATPYIYNYGPTPELTVASYQECGGGSYNSHGFVRAWNGTAFNTYVTFPSNPLFTINGPTARGAVDEPEIAEKTLDDGRTIGSGAQAESEADLPDLMAA